MFLFAVILCALLSPLFVFCFSGSMLFWYETQNSPEERIPGLKPGPLICLVHYGSTLISYIACILLVPAGLFLNRKPKAGRPGTASGAKEELPPLVLVHGINNNAGAWVYLGRVLHTAGYPVSTYSYSSFGRQLESILTGLDEHIAKVRRIHGQAPVLVCHSLGGLLARKWLADFQAEERISGLITLGTPHGGSKMAVFAPGALGKSIRPCGTLVAALKEARPLQKTPCVSLASPADEAVLPHSNLIPPQGWRLRLTPPLPHFSMLLSPRTTALVLEELHGFRVNQQEREASAPQLRP